MSGRLPRRRFGERTTEVLYASDVDAVTAGPVLRRYVRDVRVTAPFLMRKPTTRSNCSSTKRHVIQCFASLGFGDRPGIGLRDDATVVWRDRNHRPLVPHGSPTKTEPRPARGEADHLDPHPKP